MNDDEKKLVKKLELALEKLDKFQKQRDNWWSKPIVQTLLGSGVVLGAIFNIASFFIQRPFNNRDIRKNEGGKKKSEIMVANTFEFKGKCLRLIGHINENFQIYCKFDKSDELAGGITDTIAELNSYLDQQITDYKQIKMLKKYTQTVLIGVYKIQTKAIEPSASQLYEFSRLYFDSSRRSLYENDIDD